MSWCPPPGSWYPPPPSLSPPPPPPQPSPPQPSIAIAERSTDKPCATCSEGEQKKGIIDIAELVADKCHQAATVLKAAVALMSTNTNTSAELALLREVVGRLAACQPPEETPASADTQATTTNPPVPERIVITGDGSGAGSPEVYQEMIARAWTGRLGRTHMFDVDRMSVTAKMELDCYLRRTIHKMFPVGGTYVKISPDTVFATLSVFGLRLENRGPLADVTVFNDRTDLGISSISRMQNWCALYLRRGDNYDDYWRGSAMETLIELARYRGLFNSDGFLKG